MQEQLFDIPLETPIKEEEWRKEWQGMPEFIQEKLDNAYATIIVRFRNKEDLKEFSKLIDQSVNEKTQSIWHPKLIFQNHFSWRYVDEK